MCWGQNSTDAAFLIHSIHSSSLHNPASRRQESIRNGNSHANYSQAQGFQVCATEKELDVPHV